MEFEGLERPKLQGISCRPMLEREITVPTLCLTPERWMGLRVRSTVGFFPELCFLECGAGAYGVAKSIYKQFCFSHVGLCCWF